MDLSLSAPSTALVDFAAEVGDVESGPVSVVGGRTHWDVGGAARAGVREVRAPVGVVAHEPAELIVRCGAGTTVGELDAALAKYGQMSPLDPARTDEATVGGVLAVGFSGVRRLRYGPVRDLVLEARYVAADGSLVKAGAPVVKNVTGFDICRLLVGSLGLIGLIGEVVLRCRPIPDASAWFAAPEADPWLVRRSLFAPSAVLWDGSQTFVLLEGHADDIRAERTVLTSIGAFEEVPSAPPLPGGARLSMAPGLIRYVDSLGVGKFVAEIGVGTVHAEHRPSHAATNEPGDAALQRAIKQAYDPTGRLNPGRWFW